MVVGGGRGGEVFLCRRKREYRCKEVEQSTIQPPLVGLFFYLHHKSSEVSQALQENTSKIGARC